MKSQRTGLLPCIHIGMPKTASTLLQRQLFRRHRQVAYLGKDFAEKKKPCRILANNLEPDRRKWSTVDSCRQAFSSALAEARQQEQVPVWSQEALTGGSLEHRQRCAEFLKNVFGDCRILMFIREPASFICSFYFQKLRGFNLRVGWRPEWGRGWGWAPKFFTIEEWLQAAWKLPNLKIHGHLQYADTVRIYRSVFGAENTKIILYEQFKSNINDTIAEISEFIGINAATSIAAVGDEKLNVRWNDSTLERLREIEASWILRWQFRLASRMGRSRMLGLSSTKTPASSSKTSLSEEWTRRIDAITIEQNRRLAQMLELPLEKYGYKL